MCSLKVGYPEVYTSSGPADQRLCNCKVSLKLHWQESDVMLGSVQGHTGRRLGSANQPCGFGSASRDSPSCPETQCAAKEDLEFPILFSQFRS